jgi:hypothetical protein
VEATLPAAAVAEELSAVLMAAQEPPAARMVLRATILVPHRGGLVRAAAAP